MSNQYFEFEVTLLGGEPKVWRRFILRRQSSFGDLHKAIQVACGWKDSHLYSFSKQDPTNRYGPDLSVFAVSPYDEPADYQLEPKYSEELELDDVFMNDQAKEIFYSYDYGDGWIHSVKMLAHRQYPETFKRRLLAGARAFPLDDCGGLPGYQRCIRAFHNPSTADTDLLHWIGKWNPEAFDFRSTQKRFDLPKQKLNGKKTGLELEEFILPPPKVVHPTNKVIDLATWRQKNSI